MSYASEVFKTTTQDVAHSIPYKTIGKRLTQFGACVLAATLFIQTAQFIAHLPPGEASFAFAQQQTQTYIPLSALGTKTHFLNVKRKGAQITVLAPEKSQFVFADGHKGREALIHIQSNTRQRISFQVLEAGATQPAERIVDFHTWSSPVFQSGHSLPSNAAFMTTKVKDGKQTHTRITGAEYRYTLSETQEIAYLPIPLIPKDNPTESGFRYQNHVRVHVSTSHAFQAVLTAPESMHFIFPNGTHSDTFTFNAPTRSEGRWSFTLRDAQANDYPMTIELATAYSPAPPFAHRPLVHP